MIRFLQWGVCYLPAMMKATRSSILVVLRVLANVVGMIPLWKPGAINASGATIDLRTKAASDILALFASIVGRVSRSGPIFAVEPAGLKVWQAAQPLAVKIALPRTAAAALAAAVVV